MFGLIRRSLPWLLLLAMVGCGTGFRFDGTWVGDRPIDLRGVDRYTAHTIGHVELVIQDGKFTLTQAGMPSAGSLRASGGKATLEIETFMNQPVAAERPNEASSHPPVHIEAQPDGSLVLADPATNGGKPVKLTRKTQPNS